MVDKVIEDEPEEHITVYKLFYNNNTGDHVVEDESLKDHIIVLCDKVEEDYDPPEETDEKYNSIFLLVDENQHKSYCEQGEIGRMKNIYHAEGGISVIFIRYNPDNFKVGGKRQNLSQAKREELLIKWCKYYEDKIPENPLVVNYLFYDDWVPGKYEEYDIDPYNHECYRCNCGKEFWVKSMYDKHVECCENN